MIVNFEEYTKELSDFERDKVMPVVVKVIAARKTKKDSITNKEIVSKLKSVCGLETSEPRIRKVISVIRMTGLIIGLVATRKGYYTSTSIKELETYVESLDGRISAIESIRDQTEYVIRQLKSEQK